MLGKRVRIKRAEYIIQNGFFVEKFAPNKVLDYCNQFFWLSPSTNVYIVVAEGIFEEKKYCLIEHKDNSLFVIRADGIEEID